MLPQSTYVQAMSSSRSEAKTTVIATSLPQAPRRSGRQYQDINHLLGFTLPPRPSQPTVARRSTKKASNHGFHDKQRYVHQFRFVVRPDRDYTAHFADPDIHFDWSEILEVIVPTTSALSSASTSNIDHSIGHAQQEGGGTVTCPICLSEPTAARMTKCGHIFCYPCMLHYLAMADGTKWRKCPVCWESVYAKDLKFVKWHDPMSTTSKLEDERHNGRVLETESTTVPTSDLDSLSLDAQSPLPTEPLKMRLIRRTQISTLALPRSKSWPSEAVPSLRAPWDFTPDALTFAKFMLGSPEQLRSDLQDNLKELKKEIRTLQQWAVIGATDEELGIVFVQSAIQKVEEAAEEAQAFKTSHVMTMRKGALRDLHVNEEKFAMNSQASDLPLVSETSSSEVEEDVLPTDLLTTRAVLSASSHISPNSGPYLAGNLKSRNQRRNINPVPTSDPENAYFFYQAASGQNIFLQPLDIRILKSHFGTYQGMPDTIEVIVEGADEGCMNEELRRRCRWLSHLPTASDVVFIETDLSAIVSNSAIEPYSTAIKQRRNKRRDKTRREDKAKAKSELKESESRPPYSSFETLTYSPSSYSTPLPSNLPSMVLEDSGKVPRTEGDLSHDSAKMWSTRTFASALHSSTRAFTVDADDDPDFDERWHDFEEKLDGGRGSSRVSSGGASSGPNSGGGAVVSSDLPRSGGKKKKTKLVLNLTQGAGGRGTR